MKRKCLIILWKKIYFFSFQSLKMLFIVVAVYGITWLPLHILTIFGDIYPETFNYMFAHCLWLFFHWLAFSNSGINPIIYCWINKTFRSRFYRVCCIDSCHHGRLSRTYRKAILFGDDKNSSRNVKNGKFILITIKDDYSDFTSPESERKYVNCKSKKNNCLKMTSIWLYYIQMYMIYISWLYSYLKCKNISNAAWTCICQIILKIISYRKKLKIDSKNRWLKNNLIT